MPRIQKGSQTAEAKGHRGVSIPKGKTRFSKGVRPSFLSRKEAEEYDEMRKAYNRSIQRQVRRYQKEYGEDVDLDKLSRTGVIPYKVKKNLTDLEDRREYVTLKRMMKRYRTKEYKAGKLKDMRKRLKRVVAEGYQPGDDLRRAINRIIDKTSVDDIVDFYFRSKDVVGDVFDAYKENMTEGALDTDAFADRLEELLESLEPYATPEDMARCRRIYNRDYGDL